MHREGTVAEKRGQIENVSGHHRTGGKRNVFVLPLPPDTRKRLIAFYRQRDEADAIRYAAGQQRGRACCWGRCLRQLEQGDEVYETFRVLAAAGIEMSPETQDVLAGLPQDWRQICRIDADGVVRTASVKERMRSGR